MGELSGCGQGGGPSCWCSKVVSVTDNQLVLEETAGDGLTDFRRDEFTDQLGVPTPIAIDGSVLSAPNYTKVGDDKFFYTLDGDDVITHRLVGGGVSVVRTAANVTGVTAETIVSIINPADGSAILSDQNQAGLIWLHDQGDNFVLIPNSASVAHSLSQQTNVSYGTMPRRQSQRVGLRRTCWLCIKN